MPLAKGQACPEPINEALCFTPSMPDMEVFAKLPTFIQDKIKESDEFQNYMSQGMESMPPAQPQRTSLPSGVQPPSSYNPTQAGTAKAYTSDAFFDNIDGNEPPF